MAISEKVVNAPQQVSMGISRGLSQHRHSKGILRDFARFSNASCVLYVNACPGISIGMYLHVSP